MKKAKSKRGPTAGKRLLFSCILLVCSVVLGASYLFSPPRQATMRVQIPDYTGERYESLSFPSWMEVRVEYRYDRNTEGGEILSQTPQANSYRKLMGERPICPVTLVVSLGEEQVILPNVVGIEHRVAQQELQKLGFSVTRVHEFGIYEAGHVWQTVPHPGEILPKGAGVTLYVCDGTEEKSRAVPNVVGLSREDALVALWLSGFSVAGVYEEPAREEQKGTVIKQSHQPETLLPAGTGIYLWVGGTE